MASVGKQRQLSGSERSGRPRATVEREVRATARVAVIVPDSSLSTIHRVACTHMSKMTLST